MNKFDTSTRLCDRCLKEIQEGAGKFFEVHVQAFGDPTPPFLDSGPDSEDIRSEYEELVKQLADTSPSDAMDQVHQRRVWTLCNSCFATWIDEPFKNC
jgi:hypothetical protein